ncbi:MAG TPA: transketolase [Bacillota bacterium]|nr:transketolase [Bacillota bacterium]
MNTQELALKIRRHVLDMTHTAKSAHVGAAFSIADIMAVLYGQVLKKQPDAPEWPERDRFILSKGHAGVAAYAALAESGYFPLSELKNYYANGSILAGHISHYVPGVDLSTGSLGHGLPVGAGMAFAAKNDSRSHRVFVLMGDGECDEGSNWEAALFAAHHGLSNLISIIDYNNIQSLATVAETMRLEPFADKWRSFGWEVNEIDGHDHEVLGNTLNIKAFTGDKPHCIIAHTIKGKGVSFMENSVLWHYRTPQGEEYESALQELGVK